MRCFNSPGSPRRPMYSSADTPKGVGFPIRKSPDQRSLPSPRSLSQGATSFIASRCQGIHQMPFLRLRTSKTHAQGQTRTQASALAKNNTVWSSTVPGGPLSAIGQKPNAKITVKDPDASNNQPKSIAGCQKHIHNVKEPQPSADNRRPSARRRRTRQRQNHKILHPRSHRARLKADR